MKNELTPQIAAMLIGQTADFERQGKTVTGKICGLYGSGLVVLEYDGNDYDKMMCHEVTPHLRPLSSLTESEARELYEIYCGDILSTGKECLLYLNEKENWRLGMIEYLIGYPAAWLKLLSWGMDLFGGIEAGWAKEIKTNEQYRTRRMTEEGIAEQDTADADPNR